MAFLKAGAEVPTKGKGSKLTPKQELFCLAYVANMNATTAALEAGYKSNNPNRIGTELLNHPLCSKRITELTRARRERLEFSADYLLKKLMDIINDPSQKTNDLLRAIELAGKSIALWKERQEISGPDGEAIQMEQRQRMEEEVDEFTNQLKRLTRTATGTDAGGGAGQVVKFPKPSR